MDNYFEIKIGDLERKLPIVNLSDDIKGVYFFLPGDVQLIELCAKLLHDSLKNINFDIIVTAESGGIPLAHAIARLFGINYLVLRKTFKPYMDSPIMEEINSISTQEKQNIFLDSRDVKKIQCKKSLIIDDVISTGCTIDGIINIFFRKDS